MHQGCNARKVISEVYASFCTAVYCLMGGNLNTRRMSKPDMGSTFHIKNQWNILVIGNYYVNYQNYQNLMLLSSSETKRTLMHLFLFTNSSQRVYATAINFPCITFLALTENISLYKLNRKKYEWVVEVKLKPKALGHFICRHVLNILCIILS